MKKTFRLPGMVFSCLLSAVIASAGTLALYTRTMNQRFPEVERLRAQYGTLLALDKLARQHYVREIDEQYLSEYVLAGYTYGLNDDHTHYLPKEEYQKAFTGIDGTFAGIGIRVMPEEQTGLVFISDVMEGSPASDAGLRFGDLIVSVGDPVEAVTELGYTETISRLLGKEGTQAVFQVQRGETLLSYSIVRKAFAKQNVTHRLLESNIGLLRVYEFDKTTPRQFFTALDDLIANGATRLIFDMRENPGGELHAICEILDRLVPSGTIIEIADKQGVVERITSDARELDLPMVVLANENTASAAELFSATLRDYGKAKLVGTTTYGKGSVQTMFPLPDGGGVNLTTGLYRPPSGISYDGEGLHPDVEVELPNELRKSIYHLTEEQDTQLLAAIDLLAK